MWLYTAIGVFAIAVRDVVCVAFNFCFALHIFFNINAMELFLNPRFLSFVGHSLGQVGLGAYVIEVAF